MQRECPFLRGDEQQEHNRLLTMVARSMATLPRLWKSGQYLQAGFLRRFLPELLHREVAEQNLHQGKEPEVVNRVAQSRHMKIEGQPFCQASRSDSYAVRTCSPSSMLGPKKQW